MYSEIVTIISERSDGLMRVKPSDDEQLNATSKENREKLLKKLDIAPNNLVSTVLANDTDIAIVATDDGGKVLEKVDGLLTKDTDLYLSITVADCLPVFLYDTRSKAIGLIHAGWRGLANGILPRTITTMQEHFGSDPGNVLVGIGPSIASCHYKVGQDVADAFKSYGSDVFVIQDDKKMLDLKKVARMQLEQVRIKDQNIEISEECTYCLEDRYFSYRRDKPKDVEPMMIIMGRTSQ